MPRSPRRFDDGGVYHIYNRFSRGDPVFEETTRAARCLYMSFIRGTLEAGGREETSIKGPLLWSRDREVKARENADLQDTLGRPTGRDRCNLEAKVFVELCAATVGIAMDELRSRCRGPRLTEGRELIVSLGLHRWRQSASRLAAVLGLHPESVSRQSSRGRMKVADDPEFARRFEELDQALVEWAESKGS